MSFWTFGYEFIRIKKNNITFDVVYLYNLIGKERKRERKIINELTKDKTRKYSINIY